MNFSAETSLKKSYTRFVVWGLRKSTHTHRYIHKGFYRTLRKLNLDALWVDDAESNIEAIRPGTLVISAGMAGQTLQGVDGVDYCLHNFDESHHLYQEIDPTRLLRLQVYVDGVRPEAERWDVATEFVPNRSMLLQPWGTHLFPEEFGRPVFRSRGRTVFWVGSIWDNEAGQGNRQEIQILRDSLASRGLRLVQLRRVPDWINVLATGRSRIAPAIGGRWQVEQNYLPCRMFKNISFGQVGFSNVKKFSEIYKGCTVPGDDIHELVDNALGMNKSDYLELAREQQKKTIPHTYVRKLENIVRALKELKE